MDAAGEEGMEKAGCKALPIRVGGAWWGMLRRSIRRVLTPPMVVLAALFLFVEDWLWVRMTAAMAWVGRLPLIHALELRLSKLPAWGALACFFLPGLLLLPVKLAALFLVGRGHVVLGMGVIVLAKVAGTAVVARVFMVCREVLMSVWWFRKGHDWILRMKDLLYAKLKAMPAWRMVVRVRDRLRRWLRTVKPGMIARRWRAIGERLRRRVG